MKKKSKLDEAMTLALRACDMARSLDSRWCKRNMEVDKRFAELEYFPAIREWKAERDRNRQEGEARTRAAEELKVLFGGCPYARKEIAYDIMKLFTEQGKLFDKGMFPTYLLSIIKGTWKDHEKENKTNSLG